jgi:hypothetical protein
MKGAPRVGFVLGQAMTSLLIIALVLSQAEENLAAVPVSEAVAPAVEKQPKTATAPLRLFDSFLLDLEVGAAYLFQNDGRYGVGGSSYTAAEVGQQRNIAAALRLAMEARVGRHTFIATWAPLDLTTRTTLTRDLTFRTTTFANQNVVDHRYLFDGYRLSYLFGFAPAPRFTLGVGLSVQVRNASVEFRTVDSSPAVFSVERDIGLVGALKLRARFDAGILYAQADIDFFNTFGIGLAGGIHDIALTLGIPLVPGLDFLLRFRLVGGGANVPTRDIYNWGNFGFAVVGVRADLPVLWSQRSK